LICACPQCGARYKVADPPPALFRCQRCSTEIRPNEPAAAPPSSSPPPPATSRSSSTILRSKPVVAPPGPTPSVAIPAATAPAHYLISNRGHLRLPLDRPFLLGRDLDCDLVFEDGRASRRHAQLEWRENRFHLTDLGSANGTWLDSKRIHASALSDGAEFRIGSQPLLYREIRDPQQLVECARTFRQSTHNDSTAVTDLNSLLPKTDFTGNIGTMTPVEVCQLLHLGNRSGRLLILSSDGGRGVIYFQEGRVLAAEYDDLMQGDEAVLKIFRIRSGEFSFQTRFECRQPNVVSTIEHLLLEAARLQDEIPLADFDPRGPTRVIRRQP